MVFTKRSISPLIATILLIVVSVAIITIVLSWGKGFSLSSLESANQTKKRDFQGFVFSSNLKNNSLIITNNSEYDFNIIGYTINSSDYNGFWVNSFHPLENTQ